MQHSRKQIRVMKIETLHVSGVPWILIVEMAETTFRQHADLWGFFQTTHQYMPNIFTGSFKAAEANADPYKTLAAPHAAGYDSCLPHGQRPAAV